MNEPTPLLLQAIVSLTEQPGVLSGAEQLANSLNKAVPAQSWRADVTFGTPGDPLRPECSASAIILSLLPEATLAGDAFTTIARRWTALLHDLAKADVPVYVMTIFRHVADRSRDGRPPDLLERIRRLNRMAIDLSCDHGIGVIDIDHAFSHLGARSLNTDWRMEGSVASLAAGHILARSLLSYGLDRMVDPAIQQKARDLLGPLQGVHTALGGTPPLRLRVGVRR